MNDLRKKQTELKASIEHAKLETAEADKVQALLQVQESARGLVRRRPASAFSSRQWMLKTTYERQREREAAAAAAAPAKSWAD